jgi:hypothetical protein
LIGLSCKTFAVEEMKENRTMKNKDINLLQMGEQATRLMFMNIMFTFHCGNDRTI